MPGARKSIRNCRAIIWNETIQMKRRPARRAIEEAVKNPRNLGEMKDADAIGTVGSADCGDMLRMWVKFKEEGRPQSDRSRDFQTFGCQTAIAVASVATEMLAGKTIAEAKSMSGEELAAPLGALPPVKIHCAQLVEGALRSALSARKRPRNRQKSCQRSDASQPAQRGQTSDRKSKSSSTDQVGTPFRGVRHSSERVSKR